MQKHRKQEISGNPRPDYVIREKQIEQNANKNPFLLSNTEKMCDYCCQLDISASNGYRECKDCRKSFCERHIEKNNHECRSLESKSNKNTCQYCKIHSAYRQYKNCNFCKGFFCEYHLEPKTHNCPVWLNEERKRRNKGELEYEKIRKKTENKNFVFNIVKLLVIVLILAGAYFGIKIYLSENVCSGGVFPGTCSTDKPYYCSNGTLIEKASKCGCSNGLDVVNDTCIALSKCNDGTIEGTCSTNKPLFCSNKTLIINASICGCPAEYSKNGDNCESIYGSGYTKYEIETPTEWRESRDAFEYINEIRLDYDQSKIEWDEKLYELAVARSKDMVGKKYFDHVTPEGKCVADFKAEYGFSEYNVAENCAGSYYLGGETTGWYSPKEAVDNWMESRGHRYNLLYPFHTKGAIGCYKGICVFLGANKEYYGLGSGPCTTGEEGLNYWNSVEKQPYEK